MMRWLLLFLVFAGSVAAQTVGVATGPMIGGGASVAPALAFTNNFTTTCAPSGFTFARASTAWEWNGSAVLTSYSTNVAMCPGYYNAGATNYGIGFWSTRLNRLANSATPATQSQTIPTGTHALWMLGTGSATISGGSITCLPSCVASAGVPVVVQNPGSASLTVTVAGTVDFFQLETCTTAINTVCEPTAPISTTASFPTRQPDKLSVPLATVGLGALAGSAIIEVNQPAITSRNGTILYISDGSGTANGIRVSIRAADQKVLVSCETAGTSQFFALTSSAITPGTTSTVGVAWQVNQGLTVAFDGLAYSSVVGQCPHTLTTLHIGNDPAGSFPAMGYVESVKLYTGRYGAAQLQAATSTVNPALASNYFLRFMNGQSLSVGRRSYPVITAAPPYPAQLFMFNDRWGASGPRLIYDYLSFSNPGITGLTPAFEECGQIPPFLCADWGETGAVANGAQRIHMGDIDLAIVRSNGAGSTAMTGLMPGTNPFQNMIEETTAIFLLIDAAGGTLNVESADFVHGESDRSAGTSYATYLAQLGTYASTFAAQIKAETGQVNDPIWYMSQLSQSAGRGGDGSPISLAQYDIALGPSPSSLWRYCMNRAILAFTPVDGLHLPAESALHMGEYLGYCRQTEKDSGVAWKPTYPTDVQFGGSLSSIVTTWHVPVGNITIDDGTNLLQGKAYKGGLKFVDSCILASPSSPYTVIDTVSVTGAAEITVTLTAPHNSAGCTDPTLYSSYYSAAVSSMTALPTVASGGTGGTPGACVITTSYDAADAAQQATYNATISAGGALASVDSIVANGVYSPLQVGTKNGVSVTGCSLSGATINSFSLSDGFTNALWPSAWPGIRDENVTTSRSGNALFNWAPAFAIAVAP
jgi:hypothetical protein